MTSRPPSSPIRVAAEKSASSLVDVLSIDGDAYESHELQAPQGWGVDAKDAGALLNKVDDSLSVGNAISASSSVLLADDAQLDGAFVHHLSARSAVEDPGGVATARAPAALVLPAAPRPLNIKALSDGAHGGVKTPTPKATTPSAHTPTTPRSRVGSARASATATQRPQAPAAATPSGPASEAHSRAEMKAKKMKEQLEAAALAASAAGGGSATVEAREAAMKAAEAALKRMKLDAKGPLLSAAPHAIRAKLETARYIANGELHKSITFEHRVEERRLRLEKLTSSKAEAERMMSVHSAQREETRRHLLRETIKKERAMLDALKKEGVKNFAGLADAWG